MEQKQNSHRALVLYYGLAPAAGIHAAPSAHVFGILWKRVDARVLTQTVGNLVGLTSPHHDRTYPPAHRRRTIIGCTI
jgi:hypothetical protein